MHMSSKKTQDSVPINNRASLLSGDVHGGWTMLLLASFAALFFELTIIRFLSTEIRVFAYLKNVVLIASFFGSGLGMVSPALSLRLRRHFHWITAGLLMLITFAPVLGLTFLPVPTGDYRMFMSHIAAPHASWLEILGWEFGMLLVYLIGSGAVMGLVVAFFVVLGGFVGERLVGKPPLTGYGLNLAGSLAGILAFTVLCLYSLTPAVWLLIGFLSVVPLCQHRRLTSVIFAGIICIVAIAERGTYWSPYYRISVTAIPPPEGWPRPAAYFLDVNHLFHQRILDLSPEFTERFPNAVQNSYGRLTYELPYQLISHPKRVLVVGAGTGNDVAAALRHGAVHVDAVEIDPVILSIGKMLHPEHPYDSSRVTVFVNDARAFFKTEHAPYDLIVFGYLDSHTMLTSMSSVRLDNYVYTVESLRDARRLLADNGTLVLGFSAGRTFVGDRLYATLAEAFNQDPLAYFTGYDGSGVLFVEGNAARTNVVSSIPEIGSELRADKAHTLLATDRWPFLYLESRTIPVAIWSVLAVLLYGAWATLRAHLPVQSTTDRTTLHFFFLGAAFMLLETKSVTELSLLYGSTWIVNSVVIASFLLMAVLANILISGFRANRRIVYALLFGTIVVSMFIPYSAFAGLPQATRLVVPGLFAAAPVFFSGLVFSRSFSETDRPTWGLGVNLLGAVVGGVLENLVMVWGTPVLGYIALLLYGLSAACLFRMHVDSPAPVSTAEYNALAVASDLKE